MNKSRPNLKAIIPKLSGKERAKLFFENKFSQAGFLTGEEERLLTKMDTQKQFDEWLGYLHLIIERVIVTILFFNAVNELRSKIVVLSSIYVQICYEIPLRTIQRFFNTEVEESERTNTNIAKILLEDFMNKTSVSYSELDEEHNAEKVIFTEKTRTMLKVTVEAVFKETERLVNMREALRRIDEDLGKPKYPDGLSALRLNEYVREIKSAQKLNNRTVFMFLKYRPPHLPDGFKREIEDLDAYIIKTPKIRNDLVKKYMDLMLENRHKK